VTPTRRATTLNLLLLLGLTTAVALLFLNAKGTDDIKVWSRWIQEMQARGIIGGYASVAPDYPYPPLSFVILWIVANVAGKITALGWLSISEVTGIKLSLLLGLLLTTLVFYLITRNLLLTIAVQLALIPNSVDLAYLDIYFAPLLLGACWAAQRRRWPLFAVLFTLTCLVKWQPVILAPFFALYLLNIRHPREWRAIPWRVILTSVLVPAGGVALAVLAVFGTAVLAALQHAVSFPILSAQGLNFNWLLTGLLHVLDPAAYGPLVDGAIRPITLPPGSLVGLLAKLLFFALYGGLLLRFLVAPKTYSNLLRYALLGYLAYFLFNTGVHENHLFPAILLTALLAALSATDLPLFLTWALIANLNPFLFYGIDGRALPFNRVIWGFDTSLLIAAASVALFLTLLGQTVILPDPPTPSGERTGP
jgi:hypothetical protein